MFMLKAIPKTKYPFQTRNICNPAGAFYVLAGNLSNDCRPFLFHNTGGKTLKNKESLQQTGGNTPTKRKLHIPYQNIVMGLAAFAYVFCLQTQPVLAADMWAKAETIMKDVYGKSLVFLRLRLSLPLP